MQIRGEGVLLPTSTVGAYPRPHWLQGRVFGSLNEPVYRSFNLRWPMRTPCGCARWTRWRLASTS